MTVPFAPEDPQQRRAWLQHQPHLERLQAAQGAGDTWADVVHGMDAADLLDQIFIRTSDDTRPVDFAKAVEVLERLGLDWAQVRLATVQRLAHHNRYRLHEPANTQALAHLLERAHRPEHSAPFWEGWSVCQMLMESVRRAPEVPLAVEQLLMHWGKTADGQHELEHLRFRDTPSSWVQDVVTRGAERASVAALACQLRLMQAWGEPLAVFPPSANTPDLVGHYLDYRQKHWFVPDVGPEALVLAAETEADRRALMRRFMNHPLFETDRANWLERLVLLGLPLDPADRAAIPESRGQATEAAVARLELTETLPAAAGQRRVRL